MSFTKKNGVSETLITKFSGFPKRDMLKVKGLRRKGISETFDTGDFSGTSNTSQTLPSGWTLGTDSTTVYGRSGVFTQAYDVSNSSSTGTGSYGWRFDYNATGSSGTGPNGGLSGGVNATTGTQSSTTRYIYYEASGNGAGRGYSSTGQGHSFISPQLNFSKAFDDSTLEVQFWFHSYTSGTSSTWNAHEFAVAATTSATDSSSISEAISGSGLTGLGTSGGGLDIDYWTNSTGTTTAKSKRIAGGQHQSSNGEAYRFARVPLNALAGQSSVYLHFVMLNVKYFRADFAIGGIKIIGNV
jgi:hypothetical protein